MKGYVIQLVSDVDDAQCMVECVRNPKCKSYNIHPEERKCKLNSKALVDGISLTDDPGWFYKSTDYNQTSVRITLTGIMSQATIIRLQNEVFCTEQYYCATLVSEG